MVKFWILSLSLVLGSFTAPGCVFLPAQEQEAPRYTVPSELYEKALAQYQQRRYAQARDLFHEYVGRFPDSKLLKVAVYYLGHCYQMLGEDKDALAFYNRILVDDGDQDFWGQQAMARIKQIKGDTP